MIGDWLLDWFWSTDRNRKGTKSFVFQVRDFSSLTFSLQIKQIVEISGGKDTKIEHQQGIMDNLGQCRNWTQKRKKRIPYILRQG